MKNKIVIALVSFVTIFTACKNNDDPKPPRKNGIGPSVTFEKITNTNQLVEGSNDTVFFKVKLSETFEVLLNEYTYMKVLIAYGDTMGVSGPGLFVYDQSGTADPTYDYFEEGLRYYAVNFYPGESEHIVGLKSKENSVYEQNKTYNLICNKVIYPALGGYAADFHNLQLSYNYIDNDAKPVVGFDHSAGASTVIQEGAGGNKSVRIKMTNKSGFIMPVYYSISGTATNGVDYVINSPNPIIITPKNSFYDIKFDVINDAVVEGTESFTIKLISAEKALIGSPTNNTIFLRDSIQVFINE